MSRRARPRLPRDRVGAVLTTVWAAGHVAVAALLAETGHTTTTAGPAPPDRPPATRPDVTPAEDDMRVCRSGDRAPL